MSVWRRVFIFIYFFGGGGGLGVVVVLQREARLSGAGAGTRTFCPRFFIIVIIIIGGVSSGVCARVPSHESPLMFHLCVSSLIVSTRPSVVLAAPLAHQMP